MASKSFKLFDLFTTLSRKEIKNLRKFIYSPYFNTRKDICALFDILEQTQLKNKAVPNQKTLFFNTFGNHHFDALKLRGTMSDLLALVEEFLVLENHRQNIFQKKITIAQIYRKRNLTKNYKSSIKQTDKLVSDWPYRNEQYFEQQFQFQNELVEYHSSFSRTENLYLQELSDTQDIIYLIKKLKNACAQISHQLVLKTEYDFGLLNQLLSHIDQDKYLKHPAVALFFYCFKFLTERDQPDYFYQFKKTLLEQKKWFSSEDLSAPYRLALNYCIRRMNDGDDLFIREGWELYQEGINQEILLENGFLSRFTFNNMIALALLLKEYDWIDDFIEQNNLLIEEQFRTPTIAFNLARLAFDKGQYETALVHLQSAEYNDLVNILISKMLLIKTYFELQQFSALESQLDAFQQFIRRREVSDYHRKNFTSIIRFIRKINAFTGNKADRQALQLAIQNSPVLSEKEWLLKKLA